MSALFVVIVSALSAAAGGAGCFIIGFALGCRRGHDEQRVEDICELWRAMPDRDSRGRFKPRNIDTEARA